MLKKLEKKAQMEASRIAKREKVQNMLAEKQKIKEQKEHVILPHFQQELCLFKRPSFILIEKVEVTIFHL